jgi:hypothetical protein
MVSVSNLAQASVSLSLILLLLLGNGAVVCTTAEGSVSIEFFHLTVTVPEEDCHDCAETDVTANTHDHHHEVCSDVRIVADAVLKKTEEDSTEKVDQPLTALPFAQDASARGEWVSPWALLGRDPPLDPLMSFIDSTVLLI